MVRLMKRSTILGGVLLVCVAAAAQEGSDDLKPDLGELSRMIRGEVLKSAPKEFEGALGWGQSTPIPPKLRLPGLPRTTVKVGDRTELAHGTWKKGKVTIENPQRDFALTVTDLKLDDSGKYRMSVTSSAPLKIDYEVQQWLNGLMLFSVEGRADAKVQLDLDFDIKVSLNTAKFPPEISVDPKVIGTKAQVIDVKVFDPARAKNPDRAQNINNTIRDFAQGMVRDAEPKIQEEANQAIAKAIREGKGTFSAGKLLERSKK